MSNNDVIELKVKYNIMNERYEYLVKEFEKLKKEPSKDKKIHLEILKKMDTIREMVSYIKKTIDDDNYESDTIDTDFEEPGLLTIFLNAMLYIGIVVTYLYWDPIHSYFLCLWGYSYY